jgi:hypothetical protein
MKSMEGKKARTSRIVVRSMLAEAIQTGWATVPEPKNRTQ